MHNIKKRLATGIALFGLTLAGSAGAQVSVNFAQVGGDVTVTSSGTFNRLLATNYSNNPISSGFTQSVEPNIGFFGSGQQEPVYLYQAMGPTNFGFGAGSLSTTNVGTAIGLNGPAGAFFIAVNYVSNSPILSVSSFSGASFTSLGLTSGVYQYIVGGNTVTLNIPTVGGAVPEPATWAMMLVGFCMVGSALRRRTKAQAGIPFA